jgi:hypothetical protein
MAIYRLIASGTFDPEVIEVMTMTTAYEASLSDLQLADRSDPITKLIAATIITITSTGERDPEEIKKRTLRALGVV